MGFDQVYAYFVIHADHKVSFTCFTLMDFLGSEVCILMFDFLSCKPATKFLHNMIKKSKIEFSKCIVLQGICKANNT